MVVLYKTVGSYTLEINVNDLGAEKQLVIHTKSNIVSISKEISNRICSILVLNDQLKEIKQVLLKYSKIISINATNNYTREVVSKGKITSIPEVIKIESFPVESSVRTYGNISVQEPNSISENTFSASSTGTTIDDSMDSARIALLNEEDLFLPPDHKGKTTIINSTNTFYVDIRNILLKNGNLQNQSSVPGENWNLSHTFSELSSTTDNIKINICIGDSPDIQYTVIGKLIYAKNPDETWSQVFDASEYLTEENSSGTEGRICTSSDGSYVLCTFSYNYSDISAAGSSDPPTPAPKKAPPLFLSTDHGNTWIIINVPNVKDGQFFFWLNNPLMSKDGKNQTVAYLSSNSDFEDPTSIQRSGVYYSNDYGITWDYNKDPEFSHSGLSTFTIPIFYSSAMNYDGSIQYGFAQISATFSRIFESTDFGKSWTQIPNDPIESQTSIISGATNGDGSIVTVFSLQVVEEDLYFAVLYSFDFCRTFAISLLPASAVSIQVNSICMDSTGQYQTGEFDGNAYGEPSKGIIYSSDYGDTWSKSDILNVKNPPYSLLSNVATIPSGSYQITGCVGKTSDNTLYVPEIYVSSINSVVEPGEKWNLSNTFSELSSITDNIKINVCIGDSPDLQYTVIGKLIYAKNPDETWSQVFDASTYLTEENSSRTQGRICTSSDGSYVLCAFSFNYNDDINDQGLDPPKNAAPLFLSTDHGTTWTAINVPNVKDGYIFTWVNNPLMSKDGKYQTVAYSSTNLVSDDPASIQRSGVYYSNDYGTTWDYNKDPEFSKSGLSKITVPVFASSAMNYDGSVQYGFSTIVDDDTGSTIFSIFESIDFGKSWKQIPNVVIESQIAISSAAATDEYGSIVTISCIQALGDPKEPTGYIFITLYSSDSCQTFTKSVLPDFVTSQLNSICMDSTGQYQTAEFDGIYYNVPEYSGKGIIYSSDYGETWSKSDILNVKNPPYSLLSNVATIPSGSYQITGCVGKTSDNTLYVPEIYVSSINSVVEPGENWNLSNTFSELSSTTDNIKINVCIGDSSDLQYTVIGKLIYAKNQDGAWNEVFDTSPYLTEENSSGTQGRICTSSDGSHVLCAFSSNYYDALASSKSDPPTQTPKKASPLFLSTDHGTTWAAINVPNVEDGVSFLWYDNPLMSKDGKYQTVAYNGSSSTILRSGVYYSNDYGQTWDYNKDPEFTNTNPPTGDINIGFFSSAMNYDGSIQYGFAEIIRTDGVFVSIYTSADFGKSWKKIPNTIVQPPQTLTFVGSAATNQDGSIVTISSLQFSEDTNIPNVFVFYSSDFCQTFTRSVLSDLLSISLNSICMDSTGQYQTAEFDASIIDPELGYGIVYSIDYGKTWSESDILTGENSPYSLLSNVATIPNGSYQITGCVGIITDSTGNDVYVPEIYDSDVRNTLRENWALSEVVSPEFTGFTNIIAIGDLSDEQYLTTGPVTYKLVNGSWNQVFSFSGTFHVLATSGDGQYVTGGGIAPSTGGGSFYVSSDFGKTWEPKVQSQANTLSINALAMSKTGQYQTAVYVDNTSGIYYSTDYGQTWNTSDGNGSMNNPIKNITMNASGTIQYGSDNETSAIWSSIDYGKSWTNLNTFNEGSVGSISTNDKGDVISIVAYDMYEDGCVYVSLDYGATSWIKSTISTSMTDPTYNNICMSSSGQYQSLAYQDKNSMIGSFYSNDFGATWFESELNAASAINNPKIRFFLSIDSTGLYQVATTFGSIDGVLKNNQVYISKV